MGPWGQEGLAVEAWTHWGPWRQGAVRPWRHRSMQAMGDRGHGAHGGMGPGAMQFEGNGMEGGAKQSGRSGAGMHWGPFKVI